MKLRCGGIHGGCFLRIQKIHVVYLRASLARVADVFSSACTSHYSRSGFRFNIYIFFA